MNYKCCFTGYRPSKMPFSLDKNSKEYKDFENKIIEAVLKLSSDGCYEFYSGMAMGFDIIAAETILLFKELYKDIVIRLVAVIPFENQADSYSEEWYGRYQNILEKCDEKIVLSDKYFKGSYQKRNEYMVDNCDYVLTYFDGQSGGTKNTINYALKKGRFVLNINDKPSEKFGIQTAISEL